MFPRMTYDKRYATHCPSSSVIGHVAVNFDRSLRARRSDLSFGSLVFDVNLVLAVTVFTELLFELLTVTRMIQRSLRKTDAYVTQNTQPSINLLCHHYCPVRRTASKIRIDSCCCYNGGTLQCIDKVQTLTTSTNRYAPDEFLNVKSSISASDVTMLTQHAARIVGWGEDTLLQFPSPSISKFLEFLTYSFYSLIETTFETKCKQILSMPFLRFETRLKQQQQQQQRFFLTTACTKRSLQWRRLRNGPGCPFLNVALQITCRPMYVVIEACSCIRS